MNEDCFVVTYCKDGVIYPVALTQTQHDLAQIMLASVCEHKIVIVNQHPIGKAINLKNLIQTK